MDDVKDFAKKYWPWLLGGVIGLFLIMRVRDGASSGDGGAGAFYQAQAQASAAGAQAAAQLAGIQAQTQAQQAALQLEADKAERADILATRQLEAQTQIAYMQTQAAMAESVGSAATGVVASLYQPTIAGINAAAYENAAVTQAAAVIAAQGFASQEGMIGSASATLGAAADAIQIWGPVSQGVAGIVGPKKDTLGQLIESGTILGSQAMAGYYGGWGKPTLGGF